VKAFVSCHQGNLNNISQTVNQELNIPTIFSI